MIPQSLYKARNIVTITFISPNNLMLVFYHNIPCNIFEM